MASARLTRTAVDAAMREFDALGREEFLRVHGYGKARQYYVKVGDRSYDSKAILGVAYGYMPGGTSLTSALHFGGIRETVSRLTLLGYDVGPISDPDWSWDEHVLALDLYMRSRPSPPGKNSEEVVRLSALMVQRADALGILHTATFRNPNGIYMKLMNFRRLDPGVLASGNVGLQRGAKGEEDVWARYAQDPITLIEHARALRQAIEEPPADLDPGDIVPRVDDIEGDEGGLILALHRRRERDPKLAAEKRRVTLRDTGKLACEACSFDFTACYGDRGNGFIEVHHIEALSGRQVASTTRLADLACVCSNCHRMLHRGGLITVAALRAMLQQP